MTSATATADTIGEALDRQATERLTKSLEAYRHRVESVADGKALTARQVDEVAGLLEELGLPRFAFDRDVQAVQKYHSLEANLAEIESAEDDERLEAEALEKEIANIRRRLGEATGRLHEIRSVRPMTRAGLATRLGELESLHPHVLMPVEKAVRIRMQAQAKTQPAAEKLEGWLP